ncbi:metallophosphoesterase [Thermophagus sp. OGC60D27]|uniref:metallophosphoesterase n=1 Tax=Thermophagus sp. OGC60D27 TaxID=3458415 RepID=UPI0040379AD9
MEKSQFIVFFTIVISVQILVNFYLTLRGYQALEAFPRVRPWFIAFMIVATFSYLVGRTLEKSMYNPLVVSLHWLGAFWFAVMLYATLQLLLIDLTRIIDLVLPFIRKLSGENYPLFKFRTGLIVASITFLVVMAGHLNAWYPKTVHLSLDIPKKVEGMDSLRIVAVSDIHLGTIIGPRKTGKLVRTVNALNPDIILLAGDVLDEDVGPVIRQNLGDSLSQLSAPMGIYACTGNHEYIGGGEPSIQYLEQHNIRVLRDTNVFINDAFYLIGREDRSAPSRTGKKRKTIEELLPTVDTTKPVILLDHQPYHLDKVANTGVDLQISGHTHHGQLWPFGYITNRIYEVSRGYKQKGSTHFYVSTGFGTWGPPVRTGNRPEVVVLTLKFNAGK